MRLLQRADGFQVAFLNVSKTQRIGVVTESPSGHDSRWLRQPFEDIDQGADDGTLVKIKQSSDGRWVSLRQERSMSCPMGFLILGVTQGQAV